MSSGTLSGIFTAILIVLFVGVWVWAYSKRRKPHFDKAARMPLEEDPHLSDSSRGEETKR